MSTKENVLKLLEANREQSVSGEYLAKTLDVSRNAIWKAINQLRKEGYNIQAATNKGYILCGDNDILSVQGMLPFLIDKTSADRIMVYDSLASTNQTAKEMALAGAEHGTIVIADHQSAGRGRYSRQFYSPAKYGIYMSLILRAKQWQLASPTGITAFAAVTVCEAIEAVTKKEPRIKWVNDIYLDGKKICGILSEAVTDFESGNIEWVVVGIGMNFHTPTAVFPEELRPIAGAVFPNGEPTITRNYLAAEITNRFLSHGDHDPTKVVFAKYKERLMMLGQKITVIGKDNTFEAMAIDIDAIGRLIVKDEAEKMHTLSSGEISIVKTSIVNHS